MRLTIWWSHFLAVRISVPVWLRSPILVRESSGARYFLLIVFIYLQGRGPLPFIPRRDMMNPREEMTIPDESTMRFAAFLRHFLPSLPPVTLFLLFSPRRVKAGASRFILTSPMAQARRP